MSRAFAASRSSAGVSLPSIHMLKRSIAAPWGSGNRYVPSSCRGLGFANTWSTSVTAVRPSTFTVTACERT
jgi:hypothetical protein